MVQILPPKTDIGTQLGQGLGSGLSQGIQRGSDIGFQRGMLQQALSGLDKLPSNASPIEKTKYILQATAGLPDQGRILQALAPMLLGQGRVENIFGGEGQQPQIPGQGQQQAQPGIAATVNEAMKTPEKKLGGFLPRVKTPEEIEVFAQNYARQFNDPQKYAEGKAIAQSQNNTAQQSNEMIRSMAMQQVPELQAHPERIPLFMQEAQKFSAEQDPNEIIKKARQSFKGVERDLDVLDRGEVPGALKGGLQKAKGLVGITSAFAQGGQTREQAIKGLHGTVKRLIDKGYEQDVRTTLAQKHKLSPTEVEEVIHPLTEQNLSSLKRMSEASKTPPAEHQKKLQSFLKENIKADTSLLALRHKLWNEKGYDWQEISDAMREIRPNLNDRQELEMFTIEHEPPVQSLSDIFRSWDRFTQYLSRGKMTSFIQALATGYGEQEILDYLMKAAPSLGKSISKARQTGYSAANILGFLAKTMQDDEYNPYLSQEASHKKVSEQRARKTKEALKFAAGALGTGLAARAIPSAIQGIKGAFQKQTPPPGIGPAPMSNAPVQPPPIPSPSAASAQGNIPTPPPVPTQPQQITPQASSIQLIEQMGIGPQIQTLHAAGNTPEAISAAIGVGMKPHQRKWLDEKIKTGKAKSLPDLITDYVGQFGKNQSDVNLHQNESDVTLQQPEKIDKGTLVTTPSGVTGSIKSIRDREALIEQDGKLHKVNKEELIASPLSEKDLSELHNDLIKGIEKETGEEVSRNVNWAGYDPSTNTLAYLPHDGSLYVYENIDHDRVNTLTNILNTRKSTGENFIGAWRAGSKSPIGAAMYKLIKDLQAERGGKGNEYSQKFSTVYSALEPAVRAAKKKKKEEERKKKKNYEE